MRKLLSLTVALLAFSSVANALPVCDQLGFIPNTLTYVAAQYGVTGSYCYQAYPNLWACNYGDGTLAALITAPTLQTQKFCSKTYLWYNCPRSGSGCVPAAYVTCGAVLGINWRDQCSRSPL